jgi:hypothetical protein
MVVSARAQRQVTNAGRGYRLRLPPGRPIWGWPPHLSRGIPANVLPVSGTSRDGCSDVVPLRAVAAESAVVTGKQVPGVACD